MLFRSPTTILEYFSYFESSYLMKLVPKFSWSAKAQTLAPKKLYIVDPGLIHVGSIASSKNLGSLLENFVYLELRRFTELGRLDDDIFYFSDGHSECDFVIPRGEKGKDAMCIQVCWELNQDNQEREVRGLAAALAYFGRTEGLILTSDTRDEIIHDGMKIHILPAWAFNPGSDPLLT